MDGLRGALTNSYHFGIGTDVLVLAIFTAIALFVAISLFKKIEA
jgi:ABC-type multidrug transport system permease subunit